MSEAKAPFKPAPYMKYILGGMSGMGATLFVQPLDLVKNRMQLQGMAGSKKEYSNTFDAILKISQREGIRGMYKGLGAGLLRQATYTTGRLGVYTQLNEAYKSQYAKNPNFLVSMVMGAISGALGAVVGTPADVTLVRMTADGRLPPAERRNYTGVVNALVRIVNEEGVLTLWRGVIPTMGRSIVVNVAQLASYTQFKQLLVEKLNMDSQSIGTHFVGSMLAGFITSVASMPIDMAKTRIQNMKTGADGKPQYSGTIDVLVKVARYEGIFALWKGLTSYFFRLGPHTVITFILLEQMNMGYKYLMTGERGGGSGM